MNWKPIRSRSRFRLRLRVFLAEIVAPEGATVDATAKLAVISGAAAGAASAPASGGSSGQPAAASTGKDVANAPSAEKAMAEAGLSADQVTGTGRDGRIMKEDVARRYGGGSGPSTCGTGPPPLRPRAHRLRLRTRPAKNACA